MSKTVKYIIIGVVILGVLFLLSYFIFDGGTPGGIIAGIAGGWAAFKSKIFSTKSLKEEIEEVEEEHAIKRDEWKRIKEEYNSRFQALKARMDYLDYRSAKISGQLGELDEEEKKKLEEIDNITLDERLRRINDI